ncbi:periplasmic heavy metal sensor [Novosphingobium pentaromativorans]|uniref:periplasmic heavy metal sensor n=1 Tax=Novosphingobium pentaromativorans TaxID=205844 RepID=UPI00051F6882|nr:periplasmic heavy metal sensor [Novosphingobium pentaromativorans]AIT79188.1 heavy metal resistance protein [Novosphingobium pentaromativorans US6-1]
MKLSPLYVLALLILAILAGSIGAVATNHWLNEESDRAGLHAFVHEELQLTAEQDARLEALEAQFAIEKRRLELSLQAANAGLAAAMDDEHRYGPKVGTAIDAVHERMGDLQKATVRHVFDMRALLNARQQEAFDRQVGSALTSEPRE